MTDFTFITTDELLEELLSRYDHAVFTGVQMLTLDYVPGKQCAVVYGKHTGRPKICRDLLRIANMSIG
jgi:hypothetical protein